jgi:hypothetical protein
MLCKAQSAFYYQTAAVMGEKIKSIAFNVVKTPLVLVVPGRSNKNISKHYSIDLYSDAFSSAFRPYNE